MMKLYTLRRAVRNNARVIPRGAVILAATYGKLLDYMARLMVQQFDLPDDTQIVEARWAHHGHPFHWLEPVQLDFTNAGPISPLVTLGPQWFITPTMFRTSFALHQIEIEAHYVRKLNILFIWPRET
jgi:hypothetical protein